MNATISDLKGLQPEVKTQLESEGIRNTVLQFLAAINSGFFQHIREVSTDSS